MKCYCNSNFHSTRLYRVQNTKQNRAWGRGRGKWEMQDVLSLKLCEIKY